MAKASDLQPATKHQVTIREMAALDFGPWSDGRLSAVSADDVKRHLLNVRLAFGAMFRSKDELVAMLDDLGDENWWALVQGISDAADWFKAVSTVMDAAHARLVCAGAVAALRNGLTDELDAVP